MARLNVYSKDGSAIRAVLDKYEYSGEFMGDRTVTATINSPVKIDWEIGDYIYLRGQYFKIKATPSAKKQARRNEYGAGLVYENVVFHSIIHDLQVIRFKDYVIGDNTLHYSGLGNFSFYMTKVDELANRILANLIRVYGEDEWQIIIAEEDVYGDDGKILIKGAPIEFEDQTVSVSEGTNLHDGLNLYNSLFDVNYIVMVLGGKNTIIIGGDTTLDMDSVGYGKGDGLLSLTQSRNDSDAIITRLHAYGSTRNLPYRYYNKFYNNSTKYPELFDEDGNYILEATYINKLMLPYMDWVINSKIYDAYIDSENIEKYGIREADVTFDGSDPDWDEIYPSVENMKISDILPGMTGYDSGFEGLAQTFFKKVYRHVGEVCDLEDYDACVYVEKFVIFNDGHLKYTEEPLRFGWDKCIRYLYAGDPILSVDEEHRAFEEEHPFTIAEKNKSESLEATKLVQYIQDVCDSLKYEEEGVTYWRSWVAENTGGETDGEYEITQEMIDAVNEKLYSPLPDGDGRLDRLTMGSDMTDNGVSEDGTYEEGSCDTKGNSMTETFTVKIPQLFFDIADFVTDDETPTLSMKTGACAGRNFEILSTELCDDWAEGFILTLKRDDSEISSINMIFPNNVYQIQAGDEYVLTGINMPSIYVQAAEVRLQRQAYEYLKEYDHEVYQYSVEINNQYLAEHQELAEKLQEGMTFKFNDRDLGDDEGSKGDLNLGDETRYIKSLSVKYNDGYLPKYEVTLDDEVDSVTLQDVINAELTKRVTYVKNGEDGKDGKDGLNATDGCSFRVLKWEDCDTGFEFHDSNYISEEGTLKIADVVIDEEGNKYLCKVTHTKTDDEVLTDTDLWDVFQQFENIATNLLLADKAVINNLLLNKTAAYPKNEDGTWDTGSPTITIDGDTGSVVMNDATLNYAKVNGDITARTYTNTVVSYNSSTIPSTGIIDLDAGNVFTWNINKYVYLPSADDNSHKELTIVAPSSVTRTYWHMEFKPSDDDVICAFGHEFVDIVMGESSAIKLISLGEEGFGSNIWKVVGLFGEVTATDDEGEYTMNCIGVTEKS